LHAMTEALQALKASAPIAEEDDDADDTTVQQ
jgi:hypothetical protein